MGSAQEDFASFHRFWVEMERDGTREGLGVGKKKMCRRKEQKVLLFSL